MNTRAASSMTGALLLAAAAHAQSEQVLIEPSGQTGHLPGVGNFQIETVWKLGCVGDTSAVDRDTFLRGVQMAKDLAAANAQSGAYVQLAPQDGQSLLTGFDLQFTLAGTPPPLTAAVAELEAYFEARLGSNHATGPIQITIQWGPLPAGVLMNTTGSLGLMPYDILRANMVQWVDTTDVLQHFLPAGPTYPVRFDGATTTATNVSNVYCATACLQGTFPNIVLPPGAHATITIGSNYGWDFDPSNGMGAGYCLKSALAHEIVHALGFQSDVDLGTGVPTQMDLLRFQNFSNRPPLYDYMSFGTQARLVDANTPDNDVQLGLGTFSYRMEDGSPQQGSHFLQSTPMIGVMQPQLAISTTHWPDYLRTPDLRVLDALGYDWDDPALVGRTRIDQLTPIDENPNSSTSVRFKARFNRRVTGVDAADFQIDSFMGTGITSAVPLPGNAASFNGSNWYELGNLPEITGIGNQKFAFRVWIRPAVQPASGAPKRSIFSAGGPGGAGSWMTLYLDTDNRLRFETAGDSFAPVLPVLNDGNWHYILVNSCCGPNASVQIKVDDAPTLTDTVALSILPGTARVGRFLDSYPVAGQFLGEIDEFCFYGTSDFTSSTQSLTPSMAFQETDIAAYLPFDTAGAATPFESWNGGTATGQTTSPGAYPAAVPGIVDSATEFAVTVATTTNSGLLIPEFLDNNTIREGRSGAAHHGPDANWWSFDSCTMQHQSGIAYCEGSACPCGNDPTKGTWVGCLSSIGQGGRLRATGSRSIAAANLTLQGSGMPNATALYISANAAVNIQVADGRFCLGGTLVRLGTKTNVAGASQFPEGAQVPIATRVAAVPGQTTYFSIFYRNAAPYCTPATGNYSNGWSVTWTP